MAWLASTYGPRPWLVVFSENLLHMFLRCKKNINHVVVFICRKSANVGMVIAKSRMAVPTLEASL